MDKAGVLSNLLFCHAGLTSAPGSSKAYHYEVILWHHGQILEKLKGEKHIRDLTLLLRLESNGIITAQCSLDLLGSSDPPTLASRVTVNMGICQHSQLIFCVVCRDRVSSCCPGWFPTLELNFSKCWGYKHKPHAWPYSLLLEGLEKPM
ncbi:Protein PPP5D1, partial [Plecturocebus cupreus]